jgi:hypothetical protein
MGSRLSKYAILFKKIQFNIFEGKYIKNLDAICVQGHFAAIL